MSNVYVFTSAAFNYIPKVRMLFQSLRKYHPEFKLHLALADELHPEFDLSKEPIDEVLPISDLGIPHWRGWAFCHDIVELSTAIKPFALLKLLARPECSKVIYLDPDMVVFSRIDDIIEALDHANMILTPHQTTPESSIQAIIDNEICSLKHGIYNLGFIGVSATDEGKRFANWWSERIYYFCRADIPNGLFTDQRWIDLVPAFFEGVGIMKSSRHNVDTWNLTTRKMTGNMEEGLEVDRESLGFYHFTGFDSGAHNTMAIKNAPGNKSVMSLIKWYKKQTIELSKDPLAKVPWSYGKFSNGKIIEKVQRVVYRERIDLQNTFENPFDCSQANNYYSWWQKQAAKEHKELVNPKGESKELCNKPRPLTAGYRGKTDDIDWPTIGQYVRHGVMDKDCRSRILSRAWEIIRTEGISGILSRASK